MRRAFSCRVCGLAAVACSSQVFDGYTVCVSECAGWLVEVGGSVR